MPSSRPFLLCSNSAGSAYCRRTPFAPRLVEQQQSRSAFSRLAPRGTGLHLFNHAGTQVDGIGLRHRSLQKTNQCRQTRSLTKRWESFRFEPSEICSNRAELLKILDPYMMEGDFLMGAAAIDYTPPAGWRLDETRSPLDASLNERSNRSTLRRLEALRRNWSSVWR
jgi:hypothetical protein